MEETMVKVGVVAGRRYRNKLRMRVTRARSGQKLRLAQFMLDRFERTEETVSDQVAKVELAARQAELPFYPPEAPRRPSLSKHERVALWNYQHGRADLISTCSFCSTNPINAWFSQVVKITGVHFFICKQCVNHTKNLSGVQVVESPRMSPERIRLWIAYFQCKRVELCPCCNSKNMDALDSDWHMGHDLAKFYGGVPTIANLVPICADCNLAMGTTSIDVYSRALHQLVEPFRKLEPVPTPKLAAQVAILKMMEAQ